MKQLIIILFAIVFLIIPVKSQDDIQKGPKGVFEVNNQPFERSLDIGTISQQVQLLFPAEGMSNPLLSGEVSVTNRINFGLPVVDSNSSKVTYLCTDNKLSSLVLEAITLPKINSGSSKLFIKINESYQLETDHDFAKVYISTNSGEDWILIDSRSGYIVPQETALDISSYSGRIIDLKFELSTDSSFESKGWIIESITLVTSEGSKETTGLALDITNLNYQNFPFIYLNARVTENNNNIPGLTQNDFLLTENGQIQTQYFEVSPPDTGTSGNRLADIVFLVDNSGSFSTYQQAVYNNMISFVNSLSSSGVNYSLGLCRFGQGANGGNPIIEDNGILTNDANYFKNNVWSRNVVDGGYEPAYYAITTSSSQFSFRPGSQKIFIILADENADQGGATQAQAISACQNNSIAVYALTTPAASGLNTVAQQTSGRYYNITDSFTDILNDISGSVSENYLVRYKSSDTTLNAVRREIRLQATYNGNSASDTTSYVPGSAPKISRTASTLALHNNPLAQNSSVTIQVTIVDNVAPFTSSAKLYYRQANTANYSVLSMNLLSGNTWQATIPASSVVAPGLDYYITATDGQATASDPSVNPSISPYQLAVLPNFPPTIQHTPVTSYSIGQGINISAIVDDNTNYLSSVKLYYRKIGQLLYSPVSMNNTGGNSYAATVPSNFATPDGLNYYLIATDDFGVTTYFGTPDNPVVSVPIVVGLSLLSPNGGEYISPNMTMQIVWAFNQVSRIDIFYSVDNGRNWKPVTSNLNASDGSYGWIAPFETSDSCLVKIVDANDPSVFDISDNVFTINLYVGQMWFTATPESGITPLTVQFTDITPGSILRRKWDFQNDGVIDDTVANPAFTYTHGGVYSVKLMVEYSGMWDSLIRYDLINVTGQTGQGQPVAFYPFSGNANNQIGDYNHGVVSNAILTNDRFGNPNSAYFFNGTNAEIIAGRNQLLENSSNHSISVWMRDSLGKLNAGVAQYCDDNGENGYGLQYSSGGGKMGMWAYQGFSTGGWDAAYSDSLLLGDNKWHHLVGVRRNDTTFLYVDGKLQQSTTTHAIAYNNSKIRFGNTNYWQNNQYFGGLIDDARFYNYALTKTDIDALFQEGGWGSINPYLSIQSPNGGEVLDVDSPYRITWNGSNVDSLTLEYSTNSGQTWTLIASKVQNVGEYFWHVPNTVSSRCLVRVTDPVRMISDASNSFFEILPVQVPAAWDNFFGISRNQSNNKQFFTFQDINHDGRSDAIIFDFPTGLLSIYVNDGNTLILKTSLTVPNYIKGRLAEQNFTDLDNDGVKDMLVSFADHYGCTQNNVRIFWGSSTEPYFSASSSTSLSLSSAFCIDAYAIDYNKDGLKDIFIENAGSPEIMYKNNGTRNFTLVPTTNTPRDFGGYQTMTVGDYNEDGYDDLLSDVNGWVTGAYGVYLYRGSGASTFQSPIITAANIRPHSPVIKLNADPMNDGRIDIAFNAANDGTSERTLYIGRWNSSINNFDLTSFSLGNESYSAVRLVQKFDWNNDSYDDIIVAFTRNSLYTYKAFLNDGFGNFNSSETILENSPYWRFQAVNFGIGGNKAALTSNDSLLVKNIGIPLFVKVVSPNGGEVLTPGDTYNISWVSSANGYLTIALSTDGGATYTQIADQQPMSGSYAWTVPNLPSSNCLISIYDVSMMELLNDQSDAFFTIRSLPGSLAILEPNGGEQLGVGTSFEIKWNSTNLSGNLVLEFSTDAGQYWQLISANIPPTQTSYSWTVPNYPSDNCLIRLYEPVQNIEDRSDSTFRIFSTAQFVNELIDLNDNQVPTGWNLVIDYPDAAISNGRLNAYVVDASASLQKSGVLAPGVDSLKLSWDGQYAYSSWGLSSRAEVKLTSGVLKFQSGFSNYQPNNGRIRSLIYFVSNSGQETILTDQFYPAEYGNAYFEVILSSTGLVFTGKRGVAEQTIFSVSYQSDTLMNFFNLNSINGVGFGVHTSTDNDNWIDNLAVNIMTSNTGDNSLVGYWTFDNANGVDSSIYQNNASEIFGGVTFEVGKKGLAARFGGVNNPGHIKIPNSPSLQFTDKFTAAFWLDFTSYNGTYNSHALIAKDHDVRGFRIQGYGPDNIMKAGFFNGPYYQSNFNLHSDYPSYTPGQWVHVAVIIDGNTGRLYFDGVLDTAVTQNQIDFTQANGLDLYFGKYSDSWYPFHGMLDEIRLYNRALSDAEIAELVGVNPQTPSLTLTHPNGGESLIVGQADTIRWTSSNVQNVKLEYSTDGGGNWMTIIGSIPATDLNYLWEIPNSPSAQSLIRISDASNAAIADVSDNLFTIIPQFTEQASISLAGVETSSVSWGDYDNDGDLDFLLTGAYISKIYKNNGDGTFTEQTSISLPGGGGGSVSWGDYNNDGYLDILLTGYITNGYISKIYKNNGDGTFTEQTSISLTGVYFSSVSWGDYDNDGDLDILLTGYTSNGLNGSVSKIYKNNGDGTFTEQTSISLTGVAQGSVSWGDYDNDGDLDILLTGSTSGGYVSKIYKNNGDETFTEQTSISLTSVTGSSVSWGDYDNDGNLDILLTGWNPGDGMVSKIYKNNGDGTFTEQTSISLTAVTYSSVSWGDYDNDGDLDILLTGMTAGNVLVSKIYKNNGGAFIEQTSISLTGVFWGSVSWGDYDNDGDLDILLTGEIHNFGRVSKVYKNNNTILNTVPGTPTNLTSTVTGTTATFSWDKSTDNQTPQNGLHYNVVIASTADGVNTLSPMADRATGFRRVVRLGNSQSNAWTIKNLPVGKYYWSVQAIDGAFAGSQFAPVDSFVVSVPIPSIPTLVSPGNHYKGLINPITVKWNKSLISDRYKLQVSTDSLFTVLVVNDSTLTDTSKVLPILAKYSQYYWRVKAVNVGGESDWSSIWNFKTLGNPYASNLITPADLSLNLPLNGLTFKWTKAKERIETIQKYQFQVSTDSLFTTTFVNDSTLTDTTKIVGGMGYLTKYFWRVRAQNQTGWGDWSNTWRFTTIVEKPSVPVLALPVNGSKGLLNPITAKWNKSLRVEKFKLQVSTDSLFGSLVVNDSTLTDTTKVLPNLANYSQYYWRVKAVNVGGESDWSSVWNFKTLGNPYASNLITPLEASINQPLDGLTFKWTKAKERIETIQKYQFQISTDSLFTTVFVNDSTLTDTTKVVNGMGYLTKYFWRVRAQNQTGWGDWSNTWRFTTIIDKPAVPVLALPVNGEKGLLNPITAKWNKSIRVEKYKLQVSTDSLFGSLVVNDSTLTDTTKLLPNLLNYSQYYWRVKAINVGGESDWSTVWNFKTLGNPYASNLITPLDASVNQPVAGLTFKWTKAKERIETIQKYQLQISTDSLFASVYVNDSTLTDTSKIVGGLGYLTKYFWRVRAQNQTGWGDWSNTWRFTTIIEIPTVPLLASPVNNATHQLQPVVLKWKHSQRVEKYTLEVSESSNFTTLFLVDSTLTDTTRTLPQLQTPKTYYWRVKARNIGGTSDYSTVWNFRTLGFPIAVNLIAPANGSVNLPINGVLLKWSTAGEQTLGSVTSGGKGVNKAKSDMEPSIDGEGVKAPRSGNLLTSGSANPTSGIESIGNYWLEIKTDTNSTTSFYSDSTLTDTTKLMSGFGYLTTYYWRVKANNEVGWGSFSGWFKFTTIIERPTQPVLASPANNSLGSIQPVVVKWNSSQRVERYTLEVSTNALFTTVVFKDTTIVDTLKTLPQLSPLTSYYWRVSAKNIGGVSDTSSVWNFKTLGTPTVVTLVTPENNAVNVPMSNTLFNWTKAIDRLETIQRYRFELKVDTTSGTFVVLDTLLTDTTKIVASLQNLTDYYWRISAKNEAGWGEFTDWSRFTTIIAVPSQVVLSLPANNAVDISIKPVFKWNSIAGAEKYHLQVASDLNFTNIVLLDSMLTDTTKTLTTDSLNYKTKYYWRVRAQNIGGTGIYSVVWNFTTKKKPIASPTALTASATAVKRVTLSWTDNSDNELGFIILRKTGDSTSTASLLRIDTVGVDVTEFIDSTVTDTSYYSYGVIAYNADTLSVMSNLATIFTLTGIKEFTGEMPKEFALYQNYPNPFNPSTVIRFAIPKDSRVRIQLYTLQGEEIAELLSEDKNAGYYEIRLEIPELASGIYLYRIIASSNDGGEPFISTKKLILMK